MEVDDVGDKLRVGLRLVESAHDAEPDPDIVFLHEAGNDRVEGTLARRQAVGMALLEREERSAVVQREAPSLRDEPAPESCVDALNQGDDHAVPVDGGKVDGVVSAGAREAAEYGRLHLR